MKVLLQRRIIRLLVGGAFLVCMLFAGTLLVSRSTNKPADTAYTPLSPGTAWQWQLNGTLDETILDSVDSSKKMIDIDMEDSSPQAIERLKEKGITVICYLEVGAWEDYRSDAARFPEHVKGAQLDPPFDNERYLDIRSSIVQQAIVARIETAQQKGCQGIEPDIDDAYFEDFEGDYGRASTVTGFDITYDDQVVFMKKLAQAAHTRNMSFGLKNGADDRYVRDLLPHVDWALNEQCNESDTCDAYDPFIVAGKAVFQVEYDLSTAAFCSKDSARGFDGLKKDIELEAQPRTACRAE